MTVDYMLDDCFQLISLAYLTIGKNHEPPAVYVPDVPSKKACANIIYSYSYVSTIKVSQLEH